MIAKMEPTKKRRRKDNDDSATPEIKKATAESAKKEIKKATTESAKKEIKIFSNNYVFIQELSEHFRVHASTCEQPLFYIKTNRLQTMQKIRYKQGLTNVL